MTVFENKARILRYWEEVWNQRKLMLVEEFTAPEYLDHAPYRVPAVQPGAAGHTQYIVDCLTAFPDLHVSIEELIAEGDLVLVRTTWRGTHQGPFWAIPPTGRPITCSSFVLFRLAFGQLVERWESLDRLDVLHQLGAALHQE
jgi:predicted ester cyclase